MERIYDYIIHGGGPSGIALALELQETYSVALIESESTLGGCWRVEWQDGLFTEHSPRVISGTHFQDFLEKYEIDTPMVNTYKSTVKDVTRYFLKNSNLWDLLIFVLTYIVYSLGLLHTKVSVLEWAEQKMFSSNFKKALLLSVILVADTKLLLVDLLSTVPGSQTKQLVYPERWLESVTNKLSKTNVFYNTRLEYLYKKGERVFAKTSGDIFSGKHLITLPPYALKNVLLNSSIDFQTNWGKNTIELLDNSFYSGIGIQLHYTEKLTLPGTIKETPWNLVILETSRYNKEYTRKHDIQTVLSCALIDQRGITNSNFSDVITKVKTQVQDLTGIAPKYTTYYNGLEWDPQHKFVSKDTSFVETRYGLLPHSGIIPNVWITSSCNKHGITSIDKALDVVKDFLNSM
jgi:hypothetical protein